MGSKTSIIVGRSEDADVIIDDVSVSAKHMTIEIIDDKIEICDCNSTNGVFVQAIGKKKVTCQFVDADTELLLGNYHTTAQKLISIYEYEHRNSSLKQEDEPFSRYLRGANGTLTKI